uniref:CDP-diacylglycerol--inositol 3-phosphatidyltransferase (phosphatidylinositol synthase) n=1 Tax=Hucho hucho TaxID=62062 RepID=A0A4W5PGD6_9TELE
SRTAFSNSFSHNLQKYIWVIICTKFGAMLDMLTDRCATMCLLVNLALIYPSYTFLFQINMSLDIVSHWLHLHRSTSHKAIDLSGNPILRLYYTSRPVLFVMCMGSELFFCLLYVSYYIEEPHVWLQWLLSVCAVVCVLKSASRNMAAIDMSVCERERSKVE